MLMSSKDVNIIMGLILAFGNHMNGGELCDPSVYPRIQQSNEMVHQLWTAHLC